MKACAKPTGQKTGRMPVAAHPPQTLASLSNFVTGAGGFTSGLSGGACTPVASPPGVDPSHGAGKGTGPVEPPWSKLENLHPVQLRSISLLYSPLERVPVRRDSVSAGRIDLSALATGCIVSGFAVVSARPWSLGSAPCPSRSPPSFLVVLPPIELPWANPVPWPGSNRTWRNRLRCSLK